MANSPGLCPGGSVTAEGRERESSLLPRRFGPVGSDRGEAGVFEVPGGNQVQISARSRCLPFGDCSEDIGESNESFAAGAGDQNNNIQRRRVLRWSFPQTPPLLDSCPSGGRAQRSFSSLLSGLRHEEEGVEGRFRPAWEPQHLPLRSLRARYSDRLEQSRGSVRLNAPGLYK